MWINVCSSFAVALFIIHVPLFSTPDINFDPLRRMLITIINDWKYCEIEPAGENPSKEISFGWAIGWRKNAWAPGESNIFRNCAARSDVTGHDFYRGQVRSIPYQRAWYDSFPSDLSNVGAQRETADFQSQILYLIIPCLLRPGIRWIYHFSFFTALYSNFLVYSSRNIVGKYRN